MGNFNDADGNLVQNGLLVQFIDPDKLKIIINGAEFEDEVLQNI